MNRVTMLAICSVVLCWHPAVHAAPGDLDASFGIDGKVATDLGGVDDILYDLAIQPDGKIVAVGVDGEFSVSSDFAVVRYNADGTLDSSFGSGGKITTDFGATEEGHAVALQSDGKIVVAGTTISSLTFDFAIARYNSDGTPDTSFDGDGRLTTDFGPSSDARAVVVQTDGKILVGGLGLAPTGQFGLFMARYNPDGSLDATFDGDGKVVTDLPSDDERIHALALQSDGKIVAAGLTGFGAVGDFLIARYLSDGTLDTAFGSGDGWEPINVDGPDSATDLAILPDGKLILVGGASNRFGLARCLSDGTLDTTFGSNGIAATDIGSEAESVAVQSDGKLMVAGVPDTVARFNEDGTPDSSFGFSGKVDISLEIPAGGTTSLRFSSLRLQTDGKVVAGGGYGDFDLVRLSSSSPSPVPASPAPQESGGCNLVR